MTDSNSKRDSFEFENIKKNSELWKCENTSILIGNFLKANFTSKEKSMNNDFDN